MPRILTAVVLLFFPLLANSQPLPAGAIAGFDLWDSEQINAAAARLKEKLGDKKLVFETISRNPGHSMYLVLRGKTDLAEFHETESDFQISMAGTATFVIGGELVDKEIRARKQQRGSAIRGGASYQLHPGDIVHVPPAVPHHLVIPPGETYLYLLIKIDEEPFE